ncbi:MAG TPA: DUF4388 domain-containing protein [Ktedonobacteraceae bacterium]|nr:DUF4388 domain-containing protein [Ktedonobacteraceae bacterium]
MSLIGTLEQFSLSNVLRRIEIHEKTGLLVVKQGEYRVEFYFRNGRLLCIGPLRTQATLGERLVNDRLISPQALHEIKRSLGDAKSSETRTALALMDLGYIGRDELRAWAIQKAVDVLRVILLWSSGDVYFEEGTPPPADRLLVSMSVISIIDSAPQGSQSDQASSLQSSQLPPSRVPKSVSSPIPSPTYQKVTSQAPVNRIPRTYMNMAPAAPIVPSTPKPDVASVPTLMGFEQFLGDTASSVSPVTDALPLTEALLPVFPKSDALIDLSSSYDEDDSNDISFASLLGPENFSAAAPSIQAMRAMNPVLPKRIDTSFMQPEMLIAPADLSAFREQNPLVQVTPDQWRLLTCADGQTTLKTACQTLAMPPELLCQVSGELMAEHLLHVSLTEQTPMNEISPMPHERVTSGRLSNGYVAPAYAAVAAMSSSSNIAVPDVQMQFSSSLPFETESQWGNGGNGATFVPGRGWITAPQPLQSIGR